jgi:ABC-2 type transport system permease protein
MAVYKRSYRAYEGPLTARWSRFLILSRYSLARTFKSRAITVLFILALLYPLVMIALLYLNHNARLLSLLRMDSDHLFDVNGMFFMIFMNVEASIAFLMTVFIGPNMIAPDLAFNALPLYFCRPLSRTEYVVGRAAVIVYLLSLLMWVPGLVLFGVETTLDGASWGWRHIEYAGGILLGSLLWIAVLTLLALALSAWVRWRVVAGALLLGVMFVTSGMAAAVNAVWRTNVGSYLDPNLMVESIWSRMFLKQPMNNGVSPLGACIGIAVICGFCILLLARKVRAFEVVR